MHKLDAVETILARLMPPALSSAAQHDIETLLDSLHADSSPRAHIAPARKAPWLRPMNLAGIAAAAVAAATLFSWVTPPVSWAETAPTHPTPAALVLVGESDRVESMSDEGLQEDADGSTMRALLVNVVEENTLWDKDTGIVMQVAEPREELFLMPVNTF